MILTTNRVSAFDAAFESRIHLAINYPALDFASRLYIWRVFVHPNVDSTKGVSVLCEEDLTALAKNDMNGRQIKNAVKIARLLARQRGQQLALEHIEMVMGVKKGSFADGSENLRM